jgi:hypothetical protein
LTYEETLAKLKKHYDGYHFAKESEDMYNPFSLLNTFAKLDFGNYWYQTGTPTFLVEMLKDINFDIRKIGNDEVSATAEILTDYRIDNKDPIPVLYQSGYLTIKGYNPQLNKFYLGFPNEEVKYGFLRNLLPAYAPADSMDTNGTAENALKQIDDKAYPIPYTADGRRIVKVGAEFSAKERGLSRWIVE